MVGYSVILGGSTPVPHPLLSWMYSAVLFHKSCGIQIIKPWEQVPSGWPIADINFSGSWKGLNRCFSCSLGLLPAISNTSGYFFPGNGQVTKFLQGFVSLDQFWITFGSVLKYCPGLDTGGSPVLSVSVSVSCDQIMSHCSIWPSLEVENSSLVGHSEASSCHNGFFLTLTRWVPWGIPVSPSTCCGFGCHLRLSGSGGHSGRWTVWFVKVDVGKA